MSKTIPLKSVYSNETMGAPERRKRPKLKIIHPVAYFGVPKRFSQITAGRFSNPVTPSPVTRNVEPTCGISFSSPLSNSRYDEVTKSSSMFSPPNVREVMSRPGIITFWTIFPVRGFTLRTKLLPWLIATQRLPVRSMVVRYSVEFIFSQVKNYPSITWKKENRIYWELFTESDSV